MKRRHVFSGAAVVAAAPVLWQGSSSIALAHQASSTGPPTVGADDLIFEPTTLRTGTPEEAGLIGAQVDRIVPETSEFLEGPTPSFPGFVVLASRNGVIVKHEAVGYRVRYESWDEEDESPVELPEAEWEAATTDTIYDLASISKLFTEVVAGQFLDAGSFELETPVVELLPEFDSLDEEKTPITIRQLLSHTSGMIAFINLYDLPDDEARMEAIYENPLQFEPGTDYEYSDLNLIILATIMERLSGKSLDELVAEGITVPLGMDDTGFNPSEVERVAATEYQPWIEERGMVRGEVHDENAWSFGGVAGHAGLFSTASDLAIFGQMVLNGGEYDSIRVLSEETTRLIYTNDNPDLPPTAARGLGWQINQPFYMDAMTSPVTVGHTGFTGTSLVLDPLSNSMLIVLSNRVHPTREWGSDSEYRRAGARPMNRALAVSPTQGAYAWFSEQADDALTTLTAPLPQAVQKGRLSFDLWYDTDAGDQGSVLASPDGETWEAVSFNATVDGHEWSTDGTFSGFSGRQWLKVSASLPKGTRHVRFSYETDELYQGRGIYVDQIIVFEGLRPIFMSARRGDAEKLQLDGWVTSSD